MYHELHLNRCVSGLSHASYTTTSLRNPPSTIPQSDSSYKLTFRELLLELVEVDGVGATTDLLRVSSTRHHTLSRDGRDCRTVDKRVAAVALSTVLDTGESEATSGAESGADLEGHIVLSDTGTGKCSARDLLDTSLTGVVADDSVGESERGVLVELEGVATTTVGCHVAGTLGVAGSSVGHGGTVDELIATVALASVLDTSVLPSETATVVEALGNGHVGGAGGSGS